MSIRQNLIKARSHIAFVIGLSIAATVALSLETRVNLDKYRSNGRSRIEISETQLPLAATGRLDQDDLQNANTAWAYFDRNYQPQTGLVNSVDGFTSTTIWDQASYLLGLISARRIGIIDNATFDARMGRVLETLAGLSLFDGKLPNKVYDTRTLQMTDYSNNPVETGIGWSALDVARISIPLNIILYDYPDHAARAAAILGSWDIAAMMKGGVLHGARLAKETGAVEIIQEGRLGYEEYAARAIGLLGIDALVAARYDDYLKYEMVGGQAIATDSRSHSDFDAHNYVVSEPYILLAIEFGLDVQARELAQRVFLAQVNRYQSSGQITAVSEDNLDQAPFFLYNSVFADGKAWSALAEDGSEHEDKKTVSTKAAFGWDAIFGTDYSKRLVRHVLVTSTQDHGFNSGVYEADNSINKVATANTNGIILETIQYKLNGPLVTARFGH